MKRRDFFTKAGAIGVAAATTSALASPAIAKNRKQWIAVSAFGKAGLLGQALNQFVKFVKDASGGRMTIKAYHGGELVKPFEALDAVQSGTAQMGYGAPYYWHGKSDSISCKNTVSRGKRNYYRKVFTSRLRKRQRIVTRTMNKAVAGEPPPQARLQR